MAEEGLLEDREKRLLETPAEETDELLTLLTDEDVTPPPPTVPPAVPPAPPPGPPPLPPPVPPAGGC